jgi:GxxExxY protein
MDSFMEDNFSEERYPNKELTKEIIGAAMEVHRHLGSGFLESVYEESMAVEFDLRKIRFERQKTLDVFYKERKVKQFVCDFLVDGSVLVELKAIKALTDIETAQVLNYLRATGVRLGLLLNFGAKSLEYKRIIN